MIVIACAIACYTDVRSRKVPNWLTFPLIVFAPIYWGATGGWNGLWLSAAGILLGMALFIVPALMGGMGGGDLKLLMALGGLGGPLYVTNVFIYTVVAGAVAALIIFVQKGILFTLIKEGALWFWWFFISKGTIKRSVQPSKLTMPYALCLSFGAIVSLYYPYVIL